MGDLTADAVGLLDACGLSRAYLAGMSMGGAIAQRVAVERPGRVTSLTLISTSPAGPGDPGLPDMPAEARARFAAAAEPDWSGREAVLAYLVYLNQVAARPSRPFDEGAVRDLCRRVLDRTISIESCMTNHALIDGGGRLRERLGDIRVPTLVIHGTDDPIRAPHRLNAHRPADLEDRRAADSERPARKGRPVISSGGPAGTTGACLGGFGLAGVAA